MTLPEGVQPSGPTVSSEPAVETTVTEAPVVAEPVVTEDPATVAAEDASDAQLRAWAKENGIEGVPASGKLSAAWREQITTAMAAPVTSEEETISSGSFTSVETLGETTVILTPDEADDPVGEESLAAEVVEPEPVAPEFETGEYRSVFKAPNTFMSSQAFTA